LVHCDDRLAAVVDEHDMGTGASADQIDIADQRAHMPFFYAAALEDGLSSCDVIVDEPICLMAPGSWLLAPGDGTVHELDVIERNIREADNLLRLLDYFGDPTWIALDSDGEPLTNIGYQSSTNDGLSFCSSKMVAHLLP
jgi:hypothetical protein